MISGYLNTSKSKSKKKDCPKGNLFSTVQKRPYLTATKKEKF